MHSSTLRLIIIHITEHAQLYTNMKHLYRHFTPRFARTVYIYTDADSLVSNLAWKSTFSLSTEYITWKKAVYFLTKVIRNNCKAQNFLKHLFVSPNLGN